ANSVREKNGVIEFYASDNVQLTGSSVIQANGGAEGTSPGGNIVIKSGGAYSDAPGSTISVAGGALGGNGGSVEISAPSLSAVNSTIDGHALAGSSGGKLLLDPYNIEIGTAASYTGSAGSGTVASGSPPGAAGATLYLNVNSAFVGLSQIDLQATHSITLDANTTWNLAQSTGESGPGCQLILEAGNMLPNGNDPGSQIVLNNASSIVGGAGWSVTLEAGRNFSSSSPNAITSGAGNVLLSGTSALRTADGNINIVAGNSVTAQNGGIITGITQENVSGSVVNAFTGTGGNINVQAVAGNVNTGTSTAGYSFTTSGYTVDPNLGGISTASGGNVTIQAGGNISCALPGVGATASDFGSGAFGAAPGNVTLTAGGNVTGHYVVADGTGAITAQNAGTSGINLALSLITGGWVVNAADNIVLQEVRNPNGMFNNAGLVRRGSGTPNPFHFYYNYAPQASVVLDAGNNVTITGANLPRTQGNPLEGLVFPPSLTIQAGAGGMTLESAVNLFPSAEGTLNLTTTGGGNLSGQSINISDSTSVQGQNPNTFTFDDLDNHALWHLNDPNPVLINISGSVSDFTLYSPKPVEMRVTGNLVDSSATIENLHPTDTSIISVGGEILDRANYVILTLPSGVTPNFNALDQVAALQISGQNGVLLGNPNLNQTLANQELSFTYDPSSGSLRYQGIMTHAVEQALLAMTTPFLPATIIKQVYTQSQLESINADQGYNIAGPGTFRISAGSIDLGNGGGVVSEGSGSELAPYTARGADIDISVRGNLSMLSSTIESEYGGDINITCGGEIDVGSTVVPSTSTQYPLGIVSLWQGNISVIAEGDVNVDGSRIAAYDGGNIFVESLTGNVNAGVGGSGTVTVSKPNRNGEPGLTDQIPGSGILATSFPQLAYGETSGQIGNITVEAPQGDIVASRGGIEQVALGASAHNNATIDLIAGSKNSDGSVAYVGNVDAAGSGVIGGQVNISATGSINGVVVASVGANVSALQNVNATVLSQGAVTVSAGGTVGGTIVSGGGLSVSGADVTATVLSVGPQSVAGNLSGSAAPQAPAPSNTGATAGTANQINPTTQPSADVAANGTGDDDQQKKKPKAQLVQYVGRVTVLLPK
ncbi:MAG TPA: hypothetical protein VN765_07910, partial [Candidatus Acidoferrum sp.]|nr:hypothetical protein [Candidatus Acidoferrum sp.]